MLYFKRASLPDVEQLGILAREIWTTCYPGIISNEQIEYMLEMMYSRENISKEIASGVIWEFIEFDYQFIGFLALTIEGKKMKLNKLYMKNVHHGKGFGQETLRYVKNLAKENEFDSVSLTVNKNNLKAIKAYERAGFKRTDEVVAEIGRGYVMDDYIYTYFLEPQ